MGTNIKDQLDRYATLTQRVCGYTDKSEKKVAFEAILGKIEALISDAISINIQAINDYDKFYFQDFQVCKFGCIDDLIDFINSNIKEIQLFENDSEEQRNYRLSKHSSLRQVGFSKYKVVNMGAKCYDEAIKEEDPDWIYSQYGTYTQYLSFKTNRYFPICRNIKHSDCIDFKTVNYLVLLYIAVNNELSNINEELEILGINPQPVQQSKNAMTAEEYFERRAIDNSALKSAIPELLKVIEDLRPLRKSQQETENYINTWCRTKYEKQVDIVLPTGEAFEDNSYDPDMSIHDRFINWIFDYFRKLYEDKTGKTIGYAYALETLTLYHNQQILNGRLHLKKEVDLPNTNIDDVLDVIETEGNEQSICEAERPKVNTNEVTTVKQQRIINTERLKSYFKPKFLSTNNHEIQFNKMISQLSVIEDALSNITQKDYGTIALLIYDSGNLKMERDHKMGFAEWKSVFCACVGIEEFSYKPSALANPREEIKTLFHYLIVKGN